MVTIQCILHLNIQSLQSAQFFCDEMKMSKIREIMLKTWHIKVNIFLVQFRVCFPLKKFL